MSNQARKPVLKPLLEACVWSVRETLSSLVGRKIEVAPLGLTATTPDDIVASLRNQVAIVRGALDKDYAGKVVRFMCDAGEATTLAGAMMMTPDEVIIERRKTGLLQGEDLEAFAEVANVLCSAIDTVLRQRLGGSVGARLQDHATLAPGAVDTSVLGETEFFQIAFSLEVEKFQATTACILIDKETGEKWNGGPIQLATPNIASADKPGEKSLAPSAASAIDSEGEDNAPPAPIRGHLAAFLVDANTATVLRKTCRRVGLEVDRRPRSEVPNPALHKQHIVLIEVPPTDERRFDWCRRIKTFHPQTKVVLLLTVPSRTHVLHAARVGADAVLGHPLNSGHLAIKLNMLIEQMLAAAPPEAAPAAAPDAAAQKPDAPAT